MKLNKTIGRVATTLVATAMLASLAAVPAFADTAMTGGKIDNTDTNAAVDGTVTFTKNYSMPANVAIPNIDFTFTVSAPTTVDETRTEDGNSVKVKPGKGTITGETIEPSDFGSSFTYNDDKTVKTYTATVKLELPNVEVFATDGPGIYKYEVTETAYNHSSTTVQYTANDLKMAGVHDLYLFVERTNATTELKITGVEFSDVNNIKTDSWNNFYKLDVDPDHPDPDPDPMDNELTVTKTVNGDMGNRGQKFDFTVSINGDGTEAYTINYIGGDGSVTGAAPAFAYAGGKWTTTIQLAHGESARVYGLSSGDVYNIKEDPRYAGEGYKVEYSADSNSDAADGADGTFSTNVTVTTTNTRNTVSPTGIVMNVAPYALLVVIAAAGCFVFLRKRRED